MAVTSSRPRPLSIAIAIATVLLGLKVGDLWRSAGTAYAQAPATPAQAPAQAPVAAPAAPAANAPAAEAPAAIPDDVTNLSGAEIAVLQQLVVRRSEIEKRSADLDRREAVLK